MTSAVRYTCDHCHAEAEVPWPREEAGVPLPPGGAWLMLRQDGRERVLCGLPCLLALAKASVAREEDDDAVQP